MILMKTLSGQILNQLGWKITGEFPELKNRLQFLPLTQRTSMQFTENLVYGNGRKISVPVKKELFFFPMNLVMKKFGSIAVRGVKNKNAFFRWLIY
jgi:hypothetical protein